MQFQLLYESSLVSFLMRQVLHTKAQLSPCYSDLAFLHFRVRFVLLNTLEMIHSSCFPSSLLFNNTSTGYFSVQYLDIECSTFRRLFIFFHHCFIEPTFTLCIKQSVNMKLKISLSVHFTFLLYWINMCLTWSGEGRRLYPISTCKATFLSLLQLAVIY